MRGIAVGKYSCVIIAIFYIISSSHFWSQKNVKWGDVKLGFIKCVAYFVPINFSSREVSNWLQENFFVTYPCTFLSQSPLALMRCNSFHLRSFHFWPQKVGVGRWAGVITEAHSKTSWIITQKLS